MAFFDFIADCSVRACLLEVKAQKPGNVHPGRDFDKTSYSDFVNGSKALRPVLRESAVLGFHAGYGGIAVETIGVGRLVRKAVAAVKKSHRGGNTHLGIAMLLVPLSAAAGMCGRDFSGLRAAVKEIMLSTTVDDSLGLYDAVNIAGAGGLGKSALDVKDKKSKAKLLKTGMTLHKLMKYSARRDSIARELSTGMPVVFRFVVPKLNENMQKAKDPKCAIVQTYLQTLAKHPDTLIARKAGMRTARKVSTLSQAAVKAGGVYTKQGRAKIRQLDAYLRSDGNKLNPGTTADLITAGLFIILLQE